MRRPFDLISFLLPNSLALIIMVCIHMNIMEGQITKGIIHVVKIRGICFELWPQKKKKKIHITLSLEEFGWATLKWVSDQGS